MTTTRGRTRADVTRAALLDAAAAVFVAEGYVDASVSAIVARAKASVGSLYHHFGGKPDIFIALYEGFEQRANGAASSAVTAARNAGETDPVELFTAGARGYLAHCRDHRELTALFLHGDGPPGFHVLQRRMAAEWVRQNGRLIRADERRNGESLVVVLTTVAATAGREVAHCESDEQAPGLIDDFITLIRRVATP